MEQDLRTVQCNRCKGSGFEPGSGYIDPCVKCGGFGKVEREREHDTFERYEVVEED